MSRLIIGLEGHDGTGKSSTAIAIADLIGGHVFFSNDETKSLRHDIYGNEKLSHSEKMRRIEKIYLDESNKFETEMANCKIIVLDRTFFSHSVEENVMDKLDRKQSPTYQPKFIPKGVIKPDIVFQVIIPERVRNQRVQERGEHLTKRDERLRDDDIYRKALESERKANGCVTVYMRERDPKTCALRVVQSLLANKLVQPLSINLK